jgi:drug/metabolite transporter (DMT)-like permease
LRAYGALVVAVLGITWSAIFVRWAGVPGPASAFYRVFIAALVLWPWRAVRALNARSDDEPRARQDPRAIWLALAGGAFFGLDLALYNTAVLMTTASTATLLGNNAPIFVGIGSWLFFGRRPAPRFWVGLGLALLGGPSLSSRPSQAREPGTSAGTFLPSVRRRSLQPTC